MNSIPNKGISIIEIIISAAIIGVSVVGIIAAVNVFLILSFKNTDEAQGALLIEETLEVMQYLRDDSWSSNVDPLLPDVIYYILWNGLDYSITTIPQITNGKFIRKIYVYDVYRDSEDDIVSSGGDLDSGTKKIYVDVSWDDKGTLRNVNSEFLIHDVYNN